MKIERDILAIEDMAMLKQDENWQFRIFLKGHDIPHKKLDAMVRNLFRKVSDEIDCTQCGNCCKKLGPVLELIDIKRLSKNLKISNKQFHETYLTSDPEGEIIFKHTPCPFLKDNCCTQYSERPKVCRSYPHIHNAEFIFRLIKVVQNISICPIVYNVYEGLKDKLHKPFKAFGEDFSEEYYY